MKNKKGDRFIGIAFILLGILGTIAKLNSHQGDWRAGVIVKLVLILAAIGYGIYMLVRKKSDQ